MTNTAIMQAVWGPEDCDDVLRLRVHVGNLRKKLEPDHSIPRYVITEPGVGYCFYSS